MCFSATSMNVAGRWPDAADAPPIEHRLYSASAVSSALVTLCSRRAASHGHQHTRPAFDDRKLTACASITARDVLQPIVAPPAGQHHHFADCFRRERLSLGLMMTRWFLV